MQRAIILAAFGLFLFSTHSLRAQTRPATGRHGRRQAAQTPNPVMGNRSHAARGSAAVLRNRIRQCANDKMCLRILAAYGGMLAADTGRVTLPPHVYFRDEVEVQRFQKRVGTSVEFVNGVRVELQMEALKAYMRARDEAKQRGLDISPAGADAARRSYANTVRLWRGRVEAGLSHWVQRGGLTKSEAGEVNSLPPSRQVSAVLSLEERQIFFGNGFGKSILQSVATPGASQHNAMLALDIEEYGQPLVREIMARHGWFQTVYGDLPHFTYLGVKEAELAALGLKRVKSGAQTFWLPRVEIPQAIESSAGRVSARPPEESDAYSRGARSPETGSAPDGRAAERATPSTFETDGQPTATLSYGVKIPREMEPLLRKLSRLYFERSGTPLHITSGYRTAETQARAMYHNLITYGRAHMIRTYRGNAAVREVVYAYQSNRRNPVSAVEAMTKVIQEQVGRGIYISEHLLRNAFDIRLSGANLSVLRSVVRNMGGRLLVEPDHYHVEFWPHR